jgi:uncharacterized membrane-anchored protein
VLVGQDRLAARPDPDREDRRRHDRVDARLVELVDLVEIKQRLDAWPIEAGLLAELAQGPFENPLARLERARDALPEARQDPAGSPAQEEDLEPTGGATRVAEDPDVDEVGPNQSRSNRSTGRTKTVAPPTSTSSG